MMSKESREAATHYESFLEKLDALYKEFDVSCVVVNGRPSFLYQYDKDKAILIPSATGVFCSKCHYIYEVKIDSDECPECWNRGKVK